MSKFSQSYIVNTYTQKCEVHKRTIKVRRGVGNKFVPVVT